MKKIEWFPLMQTMENLVAHHVMEDEVETCAPASSGLAIAYKLCKGHFGSLPVVDEQKNLLGIVTEFDLLRMIEHSRKLQTVTATDIMTREVVTVTEQTPILEIIKLMQAKHLIRLPVIRERTLVGLVARRDIILAHIISLHK